MGLLIKQVLIADPRSAHNGKIEDILVEDGKIAAIGAIPNSSHHQLVHIPHLCASPGWIDVFAHFCDPGLEHKETLETGAAAAAAGGYTSVMVVPNTQPGLHSKSQIEYVVQKSVHLPVQILPIGAISKNVEGKELAEMYDMQASGAVAFSDGWQALQSSQLMLKALLYVKAFDGVVIQIPDDWSLAKSGLMHEGIVSTQMGLPGKPAIAETIMLARDIELLRYTQSRLHITGISTAEGIALIRKAKAEGLQITCSVTPYHLYFSDEDLRQYDTSLKVNPPLRLAGDVAALRQAVLDGTIDCIASHHQPHEYDSKICEFEYAKYGMAGLESCFAAVKTAVPELSNNRLAELFSLTPAAIFGIETPVMEPGQPACLSLFLPNTPWVFQLADVQSKCSNNAFIGHHFSARPVGSVQGNQLILNKI